MADKSWKRNERAIAAALGGERVPVNGRPGADVRHDWLAIEAKERATLPDWLKAAMGQAVAAASAAPGKLAVVVLHQHGEPHASDLVVVRLADFVAWFGAVAREDSGQE